MKNKQDIVDGLLKSIESIMLFIEKKIDFPNVDTIRLKSVVDGRASSFNIAVYQLERVKELEKALERYDEKVNKARYESLIEATETIFEEIESVLTLPIDVDSEDDDKVKTIVESKKIAGDFLENIIAVREDIKYKIKNEEISNMSPSNFASHYVKNKSK